jgi:uncharacterized protein (DUF697 family)
MTKSQKADAIIYTSVPSAMAAAAIPLPVADSIAITGVQLSMATGIGRVYDREFNKAILVDMLAVFMAAKVGEGLGGLLKTFGPIGWPVIIFQMTIAASVTTALGIALKSMCEKGMKFNRTNLKMEVDNTKTEAQTMKDEFNKRKDGAKDVRKNIGFESNAKSFSSEVIFSFNLKGYNKAEIRVLNKDGDSIFKTQVPSSKTNFTWQPGNIPKGKYFVFLDIENELPIALQLEYK